MNESAKYLIHATIAADGVVERSDVVGAIFGQTEGLLGDELDLRDLQQSSRVGRIDVEIDSENGQSFGQVTIASSLDKVQTAILAASLETIERVGPCRASIEVTSIQDVRAAKRQQVVDRAKELLAEGFDDDALSTEELLAEVRGVTGTDDVDGYEGYPAGPRVHDSDAVIVVEGRADVVRLLESGIKNAVAVEGTDVPGAVAELTRERTVTAFLDGDRGGELVLRELAQVGDVDYVAFAPVDESVEDLDRDAVVEALRSKVPYEMLSDETDLRAAVANPRTGSTTAESSTRPPVDGTDSDVTPPDPDPDGANDGTPAGDGAADDAADAGETTDPGDGSGPDDAPEPATDDEGTVAEKGEPAADDAESAADDGGGDGADDATGPPSVRDHVAEIVDGGTGLARLLGDDGAVLAEVAAEETFDAIADAEPVPETAVLDGPVTQRLLDVAAQRGVSRVVGNSTGDFVKRPVGTRVLTADDLRAPA